jgi:hypothetical protein
MMAVMEPTPAATAAIGPSNWPKPAEAIRDVAEATAEVALFRD